MNPFRRHWFRVVAVLAILGGCQVVALAQHVKANLRLLPDSSRLLIDGSCAAAKEWSFVDSYAGVIGLGSRIEKFSLSDDAGHDIDVQRIAPGQYGSISPATRFHYEVNLSPRSGAGDAAMISFLSRERGLLMLSDLLPLQANSSRTSATIQFDLPQSWQIVSVETGAGSNRFEVSDIDRAVFAVGNHLRISEARESGLTFRLVADGEWAFSDTDVLEMVSKVLRAYRDIFAAMAATHGQLILFPFPQSAAPTAWSAETRGGTVKLLLGKLPSKVGALAQISTPLTHEFFHLWVPNGLALGANYDWFYEGFTVYQASRTAVDLGTLTFGEFLNSIARAYDGSKQADALSLIEASKSRFTTGGAAVYAKSQVVAFIYDLRLRNISRRKRSLADVYRKLFQTYSSDQNGGKRSDGNEAVLRMLGGELGSQDLVGKYIRSPVSIDLTNELAPYGLKAETLGLRTYISVSDKLSKQQRELLRDLGYNDASRAGRRN
jgi:hypothetical protein